MLGGLELLLFPIGNFILGAAGTAGLGGLLGGATATTIGGWVAATGVGAAAATASTAASTANPLIGGGYQAAATDAYNNAVTGSSDFVNGLGLPFVPGFHAN